MSLYEKSRIETIIPLTGSLLMITITTATLLSPPTSLANDTRKGVETCRRGDLPDDCCEGPNPHFTCPPKEEKPQEDFYDSMNLPIYKEEPSGRALVGFYDSMNLPMNKGEPSSRVVAGPIPQTIHGGKLQEDPYGRIDISTGTVMSDRANAHMRAKGYKTIHSNPLSTKFIISGSSQPLMASQIVPYVPETGVSQNVVKNSNINISTPTGTDRTNVMNDHHLGTKNQSNGKSTQKNNENPGISQSIGGNSATNIPTPAGAGHTDKTDDHRFGTRNRPNKNSTQEGDRNQGNPSSMANTANVQTFNLIAGSSVVAIMSLVLLILLRLYRRRGE